MEVNNYPNYLIHPDGQLWSISRQRFLKSISVKGGSGYNLRHNKITPSDIAILNQFVQPNFDLKKNKGYITLTTHNAKADAINAQSLQDLKEKHH